MIKQPIGVFDSGVGGLSVLSTLTHAFPNESFIYVGDTLRAPWGSRSVDELHDIVFEIIAFLLKKDIKMLVIACNTSNSLFLEDVINQIKIPVQDLVLPTALSLSPQAL